MLLPELFGTFAFLGAFSFGGGYGMLPLIQQEVVYTHAWLTSAQFADIIAIAEITPGPVAINTATYVGYKMAGIPGSVVSTIGVVLPSLILISTLAGVYLKNKNNPLFQGAFRGLRPVVVSLIAGAACLVGKDTIIGYTGIVLFLAALVLTMFTRLNPIFIILGFGVFSTIFL